MSDAYPTCPICHGFLGAPVALPCGHTYCSYCLQEWAATGGSCPMCQGPIPVPFPNVNLNLRTLLAERWPVEAAAAEAAAAAVPLRRSVAGYGFAEPAKLPLHFDVAVVGYCHAHKLTSSIDQVCVAIALYAHLGGSTNKAFPLTHTVPDEQLAAADDPMLALLSKRWSGLSGTRKHDLITRIPSLRTSFWSYLQPYCSYRTRGALITAVDQALKTTYTS